MPRVSASSAKSRVRLATFNLLRLGHSKTKELERVAKLIEESGFDVVAATEVMTLEGLNSLEDTLRRVGSSHWRSVAPDSPTGSTSYKEFVAYLYRSDRVKPTVSSYCRAAAQKQACYFKSSKFAREPYIASFDLGKENLTVLGAHLVYGGSDKESIALRQTEVEELARAIALVGSKDENVIAAGDFNLELDADSRQAIPGQLFKNGYRALVDDPTTVGQSNYDHVLYQSKMDDSVIENSAAVWTDLEDETESSLADYKKKVSDHFPISVDIEL
jgi:endonuclease/exonuclease/phosphatase family metal-dependent hydrolase